LPAPLSALGGRRERLNHFDLIEVPTLFDANVGTSSCDEILQATVCQRHEHTATERWDDVERALRGFEADLLLQRLGL